MDFPQAYLVPERGVWRVQWPDGSALEAESLDALRAMLDNVEAQQQAERWHELSYRRLWRRASDHV